MIQCNFKLIDWVNMQRSKKSYKIKEQFEWYLK